MAGDDTHHQPRAGPRISELERGNRLAKTARPPPFDLPGIAALFR
jgi:hypothetical protein